MSEFNLGDFRDFKKEIMREITPILKDINMVKNQSQNQNVNEVQKVKENVFDKLTNVLNGVQTPELEFILGSENIKIIENEMMFKFNAFLFEKVKNDFADAYPDICKNYIDVAIKNKEDYIKMNLNTIKNQEEELNKERQRNNELQTRLEKMEKLLIKEELL